jgi:hypothetical protein
MDACVLGDWSGVNCETVSFLLMLFEAVWGSRYG